MVGWLTTPKNNKFMQLKDGYGQIQIVIDDQNVSISINLEIKMCHSILTIAPPPSPQIIIDANNVFKCQRKYCIPSDGKSFGQTQM